MSTRRTSPLLGGAAALALLLAGCGGNPTPVTRVGLSRDTPEKTYEYFKTMVANNQHAAEWAVFSPNAKRQANQMAGKNVDLSDYSTARNTIATNSQGDMQALLNSTLVGVSPGGGDRATVTIQGGGRQVSVRMARLTSWELRVRGEDTPYGDFIRSAADAVAVGEDGSITVRVQPPGSTGSFLKSIPRENIEGFSIRSQWYIDDLSSIQGAMPAGPGPTPGAAPAPGATQPVAPRAPSGPAPATATGSPD